MICAECGTKFLRMPGKSTKWCSDGCKPIKLRDWWKASNAVCFCLKCGDPYTPKTSHQQNRYCSEKCRRAVFSGTISARLNIRMRQGLRRSLGKKKAERTWESLVDFNSQELKRHLEAQFISGMSWEKFKDAEIHIDHIVPLSSFTFDSTDDPEFKRAWSLTNLRPMWAKDNLSKGSEIRHLI